MKAKAIVNAASAKQSIGKQLDVITRQKSEMTGKAMVLYAEALMAGQFNLSRDYERRRHPGSRRAANALDHVITTDGNGDPTVEFRVLGGDDVLMRILIMNYGSVSHDIHPNGNWELGGLNPKKVSRTASKFNTSQTAGNRLAYPSKEGGYWKGKPGQYVTHPGTNATNFLEEARNQAVAEMRYL
jgi:hypothetical protein